MLKYRILALLLMLLSLYTTGCSEASGTDTLPAATSIVKQAKIMGTVKDGDGDALIAQIVIHGNDSLYRINTDLLGRYTILLPLGEYSLEYTKGSEFERKQVNITIEDRAAKYLDEVRLSRLYATEWLSGDLHQHSVYSFDATDSPADILLSDLSMGMSFGVITDHNDIRANSEFTHATLEGFIPLAGIEITTTCGHYNAFNFNEVVDVSVGKGAQDIERIASSVKSSPGALIQINHPLRVDNNFAFQDWQLLDLFDTMELWNGKSLPPTVQGEPNALTRQKWFELLNQGIYIPATAGSDNHDIAGNRMFMTTSYANDEERCYMESMYSGMPRNYVYARTNDLRGILGAIKGGNSFLTNNPLVFLDIDGSIPGETAAAGQRVMHLLVQSNRKLTRVRVIKNGIALLDEEADGLVYESSTDTSFASGDWVILEAYGESGDYAFTNPVFIK